MSRKRKTTLHWTVMIVVFVLLLLIAAIALLCRKNKDEPIIPPADEPTITFEKADLFF